MTLTAAIAVNIIVILGLPLLAMRFWMKQTPN